MNRLNINQAWCEALFASGLQRSDTLTASALTEVISRTVRQLGISGCISLMAQEFGDHPEAAAERMRWVRQLADEAFAPRAGRHRALGRPRHPQCLPHRPTAANFAPLDTLEAPARPSARAQNESINCASAVLRDKMVAPPSRHRA